MRRPHAIAIDLKYYAREAYKIRDSSLELTTTVWKPLGAYCARVLEEAVSMGSMGFP